MVEHIAVIDIDNTIADTQTAIKKFLEKRGVDPRLLLNFPQEFRDDTPEHFSTLISEFIYSHNYDTTLFTIPLYTGVLEALSLLQKSCKIYVVSSRINNWHTPTEAWLLANHVKPLVSGIYLRDQSESSLAFKKRVISELKADVVFEDSLEILKSVTDVNLRFLIDHPWNQENISSEGYVRVKSFVDAVGIFTNL